MNVESIIDGLIQREGEYVNRATDRGGPTRYGITEAVARANGYTGDMRALPIDLARRIYRQSYYIGPGFDQVSKLSAAVAEEITDTGVNMGVPVAAKFLQRLLNVLNQQGRTYADVEADGHFGPASFAALSAFLKARGAEGERVLLTALNCLQGNRYVEIAEKNASQEDYIYGWLRKRVIFPGEKAS